MSVSLVPGAALAWSPRARSAAPCILFEAIHDGAGQPCDFRWTALNPAAEALVRELEGVPGGTRWEQGVSSLLDVSAGMQVLATGQPHVGELRCRLQRGEVLFHTTVVRQGEGLALWLQEVLDVRQESRRLREELARERSARLRAEEALQAEREPSAREEQLRLALETARMVTWEWTRERRSVRWSAHADAFFGQAPGGLGNTLGGFLACVLPSDRERVARTIEQGLGSGGPYSLKFRCRWADGGVHCYEAAGRAFHEGQRAHRMLGVVVDCTEREQALEALRAAEERYRLAAWATNDVLWEWRFDTGRVMWSEACRPLFGYTQEPQGHTFDWWSEQVHPEDRQAVRESVRRFLEGDSEEAWRAEYRFRCRDGSWKHVLDRGVLARDEGGRPTRMVGSMMDLTERKRALERLAQEAQFRERFIGILGHDLRNPLNAISLSARGLRRRGPLTSVQEDFVQRIEASAARMGTMISDILDLTRARLSGGIPLSLAPVRLDAVCRQVVEELSAGHPGQHIAYEDDGGGEGRWDAERLAQVVSNLLGNALEHGAADAPVFLRTWGEGDWQVLEVNNGGPPIPQHQLATLFDPFRQGEAARGKRRSGLGLGLFIVKEIVHAHGGHVAVRSSAEEGTTFTVLLPYDARKAGAERGTPGEVRTG
ncbi:PAS domain-containing protein [Myxococcaceae bacterium GXIMD 01537]